MSERKCNSECGYRMSYPISCNSHDCGYITGKQPEKWTQEEIDTANGKAKILSDKLGIQQSTTDEKMIDLFFERFPSYSSAVIYDKDLDCFIGSSAMVAQQLIDIWNSRYQLFKAGYKTVKQSAQAEIQQLKDHITAQENTIIQLGNMNKKQRIILSEIENGKKNTHC